MCKFNNCGYPVVTVEGRLPFFKKQNSQALWFLIFLKHYVSQLLCAMFGPLMSSSPGFLLLFPGTSLKGNTTSGSTPSSSGIGRSCCFCRRIISNLSSCDSETMTHYPGLSHLFSLGPSLGWHGSLSLPLYELFPFSTRDTTSNSVFMVQHGQLGEGHVEHDTLISKRRLGVTNELTVRTYVAFYNFSFLLF